MKIENIHQSWGSIVHLDTPQEFFNYSADYWRNLMYDRKLIFFKKVEFTKAEYAEFSLYFGGPWSEDAYKYSREVVEAVETKHGTITVSPFNNANTKLIDNREMPWHADIPNRSFKPFPFRSLWITDNPNPKNSGKTNWLNLEEAMNYLTPEMRDMLPRVKVVQQSWYEEATDIQEFDLVKIHPITGKLSLRLNYYNWGSLTNAWIKDIIVDGISQNHCMLVRQWLFFLQKIKELTYQHTWDLYDIAVYDNWPLLHGRTALNFDAAKEIRNFYRINIDHLDDIEWADHKGKFQI